MTPVPAGTLAQIDRILADGRDADDVLRAVVATLHARAGYAWAGLFFVEADGLTPGPEAGRPEPALRTRLPVSYGGVRVAELAVDGAPAADIPLLERVADRIAAHCLVGWDTGGEAWEP